jgi:hypothetical protein
MRLWPVAWEDVGTITVATAEQASLWIEGASTGQKFFRVIER